MSPCACGAVVDQGSVGVEICLVREARSGMDELCASMAKPVRLFLAEAPALPVHSVSIPQSLGLIARVLLDSYVLGRGNTCAGATPVVAPSANVFPS